MTLHPEELGKIGNIGEQFSYDVRKMHEINQKAINRMSGNSVPELDSQQQIVEINPDPNTDYITP